MTAVVVVVGTTDECADVLEILKLAADVTCVRTEEPPDGMAVASAHVRPDSHGRQGGEPR